MKELFEQMPKLNELLGQFYAQLGDAMEQTSNLELKSQLQMVLDQATKAHADLQAELPKVTSIYEESKQKALGSIDKAKSALAEAKAKRAAMIEAAKDPKAKAKAIRAQVDAKMGGPVRQRLLERIRGLKPMHGFKRRGDDREFIDWAYLSQGGNIAGTQVNLNDSAFSAIGTTTSVPADHDSKHAHSHPGASLEMPKHERPEPAPAKANPSEAVDQAIRELEQTITFLANTIPVREAVWWACLCIISNTEQQGNALPADQVQCVEAAVQWVLYPDEARRVALEPHLRKVGLQSAAGLLGLAVLQSTGGTTNASRPFTARDAIANSVRAAGRLKDKATTTELYRMGVQFGHDVAQGRRLWDAVDAAAPPPPASGQSKPGGHVEGWAFASMSLG